MRTKMPLIFYYINLSYEELVHEMSKKFIMPKHEGSSIDIRYRQYKWKLTKWNCNHIKRLIKHDYNSQRISKITRQS